MGSGDAASGAVDSATPMLAAQATSKNSIEYFAGDFAAMVLRSLRIKVEEWEILIVYYFYVKILKRLM
ncbi:hypothetical protein ACFXTN_024189 [Malus domestica]